MTSSCDKLVLLANFKAVSLTFDNNELNGEILIKQHSSINRSRKKPRGKTISFAGIPAAVATKDMVKTIFGKIGHVAYVTINTNQPGDKTRSGDVVFTAYKCLKVASELTQLGPFKAPASTFRTEFEKWFEDTHAERLHVEAEFKMAEKRHRATLKLLEKLRKQPKLEWGLTTRSGCKYGIDRF